MTTVLDRSTPILRKPQEQLSSEALRPEAVSRTVGKTALGFEIALLTTEVSLNGPESSDSEDLVGIDDLIEEAKVNPEYSWIDPEMVASLGGRVNKLLNRSIKKDLISKEDITEEEVSGIRKSLITNLGEIIKIMDISHAGSTTYNEAAVLAAYYHEPEFISAFLNTDNIRKVLIEHAPGKQGLVDKCLPALTPRDRLLKHIRNSAQNPYAGLLRDFDKLAEVVEDLPGILESQTGLSAEDFEDFIERVNVSSLLRIVTERRGTPAENVSRVIETFDRISLETKESNMPESLLWKICFQNGTNYVKTRKIVDKLISLNNSIIRPDNISESSWWGILFYSGGDPQKISQYKRSYYRNAAIWRDKTSTREHPRYLPKKSQLEDRIEALSERGIDVGDLFLALEFGYEFIDHIVDTAEKMEINQANKLVEVISEIWGYSDSIADQFVRMGHKKEGLAFRRGMNIRVAQLLAAAKESLRPGGVRQVVPMGSRDYEVVVNDPEEIISVASRYLLPALRSISQAELSNNAIDLPPTGNRIASYLEGTHNKVLLMSKSHRSSTVDNRIEYGRRPEINWVAYVGEDAGGSIPTDVESRERQCLSIRIDYDEKTKKIVLDIGGKTKYEESPDFQVAKFISLGAWLMSKGAEEDYADYHVTIMNDVTRGQFTDFVDDVITKYVMSTSPLPYPYASQGRPPVPVS